MKIEPKRADLETVAGLRPDAARDERAAAAERAAQEKSTDQVRVSTASQLAAAAAAAASQAPDVRPDAVERGRALLASGDLGRDADRLAEALIDSLIDKA